MPACRSGRRAQPRSDRTARRRAHPGPAGRQCRRSCALDAWRAWPRRQADRARRGHRRRGGGRVRYDGAVHGERRLRLRRRARPRRGLLEASLDHAGPMPALRRGRPVCAASATPSSGWPRAGVARAPFVVGADGRASRVASSPESPSTAGAYDQRALTMVLQSRQAPDPDGARVAAPRGPLATLPLRGRRGGITWVERRRSHCAGRPARRGAPGTPSPRPRAACCGRAEIESGPGVYPLGAQHARSYVAPRVALVGDAAHGVHPIHAQGFNMGVADVGALVDALAAGAPATRSRLRRGAAAYARARRGDNTQRLWLTDGLVRLFTADLPRCARPQPRPRRDRARPAAQAAGGPARHADRLSVPDLTTAASVPTNRPWPSMSRASGEAPGRARGPVAPS